MEVSYLLTMKKLLALSLFFTVFNIVSQIHSNSMFIGYSMASQYKNTMCNGQNRIIGILITSDR